LTPARSTSQQKGTGVRKRQRIKTELDTPRADLQSTYSTRQKKDRQSYLAQQITKTTLQRKDQRAQEWKEGTSGEGGKRKPIKIAIDIPLEEFYSCDPSRVGEYRVESSMGLEGEEVHIIREVAERVMSLLHKSKGKLPVL